MIEFQWVWYCGLLQEFYELQLKHVGYVTIVGVVVVIIVVVWTGMKFSVMQVLYILLQIVLILQSMKNYFPPK